MQLKFKMKIQLLTASVFFLFARSYAQENCAILKNTLSQKESIITNQNNTISKLTKDIEYYKVTLNLMSSSTSTIEKDVNFKINSVIGNIVTGKVIIEGILINSGAVRSLQVQSSNSIDPQGNISKSYKMTLGGETRLPILNSDVPVKFSVEFSDIVPNTTDIKQLVMNYFSMINYKKDDITVTFKNLTIDWK